MQRKSMVVMVAMTIGLLLGFVLGPALRGSTANAQTEPQAQAASPIDTLRNSFLDKLAAALNIQRSALDSAITTAGTETVGEAEQQGTLTPEQADMLRSRIQNGDLGALWGGRHGGSGGPRVEGLREALFDAAAKTLGVTADDLMTQLRDGQSLAAIAQANGTTEQAVVDAALAAGKTQLDQAVAAGTVTQAQADAIYSHLQQKGAELLSGLGGRRGDGGPSYRPGADGSTSEASTTPEAPATDTDA